MTRCKKNHFMSKAGSPTNDRECAPCPDGQILPENDHHLPATSCVATTSTTATTATTATSITTTTTTTTTTVVRTEAASQSATHCKIKMAQHLNSSFILRPAPWVLGVPTKIRLESRFGHLEV